MLDEVIDERLDASGYVLDNAYKQEIRDQGLVDSGQFINSVQHHVEGKSVSSGTDISEPPYPVFLEFGFRHHLSGEIVGPYRPLTKGAAAAEGPIIALWKVPIK